MKSKDKAIKQYLALIGSKGGTVRAERHGKDKLSEWGKKGGRPKKKVGKK
jgi:general stress protein YciG